MPSIYVKDDARLRAEEGIRYDFLAPDGSESREAAAVIAARNLEFNKGIPSSQDYLDMKLAVEALSGGTNTVILDDRGLPSVMVLIPKMDSADLSNGLKSRTHPAFIVNGQEHDTVAVGKYLSIVKDGRAYSLPMKNPKDGEVADFDKTVAMCTEKGAGWNITPYALWGALALWTKKNGTMPQGNSHYGQYNDDPANRGIPAYMHKHHETGLPVPGATLTGSGPLSWFHNHRHDGIADLCGNSYEWCSGFRWLGNELQLIENADVMAPGCDTSRNSDLWRAILPDGSLTDPGDPDSLKLDYVDGIWKLCRTVTDRSGEKHYGIMRQMELADGLTEFPQILIELGFCPERQLTGARYGNDVLSGPDPGQESIPCRGGNWYDYIYTCAGMFRSSFWYGRDVVGIGMRLAYYKV